MLSNDQFAALKSTGNLPSPRGSALRVIDLCDRGDSTLPEIIAMLNTDPATVGRVLKLANAAIYGRPRPAAALTPDVLMTIGIRSLRQLVLAFSLVGHYRHGRCRPFDYTQFWSRSLAQAVACQWLGVEVKLAPSAEMFTCGLLARIGTLALASIHPEKYGELLKDEAAVDSLTVRERAAFGLTHTELSVAMLADFGLPKLFTEAVATAESPEKADFPLESRTGRILICLVLADRLVSAILGPSQDREAILADILPWAEKLGLNATRVAEISGQMRRDWQEWSRLLEIATNESKEITADEIARVGPAILLKPPPGMDKMSVLVVDDDPTTRALLKKLLTSAGHEVFVAPDGREGFRLATEKKPDLMIVDWSMPEMDGLTLIRTLRGTSLGEHIYIVMLTAHDESERLIDAFEAGADDFIGKPIEPRILQARMIAGLRTVTARRAIETECDLLRANVDDLTTSERKAWDAALTDPLTNLYNRRYAIERLNIAWAAGDRAATLQERPLSVILADLDHFKSVNDLHGHAMGDAVLKQFAEFLRSHSRLPDVTCRIGGEEFLILLPDTSLEGAMLHAERIRNACASEQFEAEGKTLSITVSLGVAERTTAMTDHDDLLKAADNALYAAKRQGRNQVVAAN
ncbi:MAG: diguanylate cyclase [Rhodocyclaceae bacterium]|nr:diguanylate cyclase [Rhodocyclaceae bacterium]